MSGKHLSKGSPIPPIPKGMLRLYSMRFCPYAQRVHLVMDAKKIPHDVVYVNLVDKPEWLFEKSPMGRVPVIEIDGDTLYESLVIADFLDERYPQHPLHARDAWKKAKDRILIEHFNGVISSLFKIRFPSKGSSLDEDHREEFFSSLEIYEKELVARGKPYFGGEKPGMLDYMIWPWCERADVLKIIGGDQYVLPKERFTRMYEWREAMKEDEAVKKSFLEPTIHAKYFQSQKAGCPDYDLIPPK